MPAIDADAHVIETEHTWDYLEGRDKRFRPVPVSVDMPEGGTSNFWVINGKLIGGRDNIGLDTPKESRDMADIDARLKHMDEIGTDIQVLYPTLFLRPVTDREDVELALCRSYNRWLADIWAAGKGRLRWAVQLPLSSMDEALDELRWATEHGACAVFMRGLETNHPLHHPYFFPLYEEAARLNVPIGVHSGIGNAAVAEAFGNDPFPHRQADRHRRRPRHDHARHPPAFPGAPHRRHRGGGPMDSPRGQGHHLAQPQARVDPDGDLLPANRLYVACQTDDDLPYVLQHAGEDMIMVGSDYGHNDNASELLALKGLREKGEVAPHVIDKILDQNPSRFYGLSED